MGDVFTEAVFDEDPLPPPPPPDSIDLAASHLSEPGARATVGARAIASFTRIKKMPSFSEPSRSSNMQSVTVIVDRPGPLLMQLKMHPSRKCVMLHGFDRDEDGERGELELSGKLAIGDLLVDINGKSLERRSFKDVLIQIRQEGASGGARVLSLIRFPDPGSEADYFGHDTGTLRDSGCFTRSEADEDFGAYIFGILEEATIDVPRLRRVAAKGLPPVRGLRPLVWMVLHGYLPEKRALWDVTLEKSRNTYQTLKEEFKICPTHADESAPEDLLSSLPPGDSGGGPRYMIDATESNDDNAAGERIQVVDDPLQTDRDKSHWARYFEDRQLLESVEKDVVRTYPEQDFFDGTAQAALKAILFIYAKLNPGVSYVQGMNELVGTLYFVFAQSALSEEWGAHAEADTFFCFTALMSEFQDLFIYRLDDTTRGLQGTIERYCQLLAAEDPHLHKELQTQGLEATYYTVRWVTTLFSREFELPETIRLWDTLFADSDPHEFLSFMCFTMTTEQRDFIFSSEFADNLKMLQSYPLKDVPHLLEALELTRCAVRDNKVRRVPGHPLRPGAHAPNGKTSYLTPEGRQMIYNQLKNVDTDALKASSYDLLSKSVSRIMTTAGNAMDALDNAYVNSGSDDRPSAGDDDTSNKNSAGDNDDRLLRGTDVVRATQETASIAGRWAWQSLESMVSLASSHIGDVASRSRENTSSRNTTQGENKNP